MLMGYNDIIKNHNLNIRGVIHIGAHWGEEIPSYGNIPIIAFEPLKNSFKILSDKFKSLPNVTLVNKALGDQIGQSFMYVETANGGQSSSILKPKLHLTQYPHITFDSTEQVEMIRLDDYEFDKQKYNFINIDVQGYELKVFKGAENVLQYIDYIYAEVNRAEVYEGCAQIGELDEYLAKFDFERVAVDWSGNTWGDALWIKKKNNEPVEIEHQNITCSDYVIILPNSLKERYPHPKAIYTNYIAGSLNIVLKNIPKDTLIFLIAPTFSGDLEDFVTEGLKKFIPRRKVWACNEDDYKSTTFGARITDIREKDSLVFYGQAYRKDLTEVNRGTTNWIKLSKVIAANRIMVPMERTVPIYDGSLLLEKVSRIRPFNKKISIILGTLNRKHLLPGLIENTADRCENIELIIADGGSTDGTLEYLKSLKHPRIKLIEIGHTSSYPNFMNIALSASNYEWICQWTDDSYLIQSWEEVMDQLDESDFYLFTWKWGNKNNLKDPEWLKCDKRESEDCNGWKLYTKEYSGGDIVLNMGIYRKQIFRDIGMYSEAFNFWCADGDMSERAYNFGYKPKILDKIQVLVHDEPSRATSLQDDYNIFVSHKKAYSQKEIPLCIPYLRDKLKITVFIPSTPNHFQYLEEIIEIYKIGIVVPDEIIISLSNSHLMDKKQIDNLENSCPFVKVLRHKEMVEAGPSRQFAQNTDADIIIYQDSDDKPHVQRVEFIRNIFYSDPDIWVINHSYSKINDYTDILYNFNFETIYTDQLLKMYFPNNTISEAKKQGAYGGGLNFPVHAGAVCIRKEVLDTIKWKKRDEQTVIPPPRKEGFRGAGNEDMEFCMEALFYLKKSIIINCPLYFYR